MVLTQVSQSSKSTVAQALILRELVKLSRSIHDMHAAVGDARRARDVRVMMQNWLALVRDRMPAVDGAQSQRQRVGVLAPESSGRRWRG